MELLASEECTAGSSPRVVSCKDASFLPSAAAFEGHHSLHHGLTLLGDFVLFARTIRTVLTQLLGFAVDLHAHQLVRFVATSLANRHSHPPAGSKSPRSMPARPRLEQACSGCDVGEP